MPLQTLISYIYHWPWPCRRIPRCVWWCSPGWPTPDSGSQDSGTSGSFLVPRKCWRCRSKCDLCHPARSLGADFSTIGIIQICLYLLIVYVHSLMALYKNFEIDETYDEMIVEIFFHFKTKVDQFYQNEKFKHFRDSQRLQFAVK